MRIPRVAVMLLSLVPDLIGAQEPVLPTRAHLVSAILRDREMMFEQRVLIDGCSLDAAVDSVTKEKGVLEASFREAVRGTGDQCRTGNYELFGGRPYIMSFALIQPGPGDLLPTWLKEPAIGHGYRFVRVLARLTRIQSGQFHGEEWLLQCAPNGRCGVFAMRIVGLGTSG